MPRFSKAIHKLEPKVVASSFLGNNSASDSLHHSPSSGKSRVIVDVIETSSTDKASDSHDEESVLLTIKSTTGLGSSLSHSEGTEITMSAPRKLDKFGFILNLDANGMVYENRKYEKTSTSVVGTRGIKRREQKWDVTLNNWERRRPKKVKDRLRKGVPDAVRGKVWLALGGGIREPGLYQEIVRKTSNALMDDVKERAIKSTTPHREAIDVIEELSAAVTSSTASETSSSQSQPVESPKGGSKASPSSRTSIASVPSATSQDYAHSKEFRTVQETIERDIHRTFPRHNLFYEEQNSKDDEVITNAASSLLGLTGMCDPEMASLLLNLQRDMKTIATSGATSTPLVSTSPANNNLTSPNGQAALRRVLRAYSYYDREISYCQGMNFIAGMFLTVVSEEESFWLLVSVMYNKPYEMRGMFGEGMRETHKVLYVAESLMHSHLPKLARHFDRENIHVTMFATQWLLTQYTSSFKFDLVTRVWDAFLGEGWKIIYRVMLALLQQYQSKLMKMSFEEILAFFRDLPEKVNGHVVMETALKIKLTTKQIVRLEKEWRAQQR